MIGMKKWKKLMINQRTLWFIKRFKLYKQQCHHIAWSVENILKVKTKSSKKKKRKNGLTVTLNCVVCCSKKSRFIRKQEASRLWLLSSLGIKTVSSPIHIVGPTIS